MGASVFVEDSNLQRAMRLPTIKYNNYRDILNDSDTLGAQYKRLENEHEDEWKQARLSHWEDEFNKSRGKLFSKVEA